MARDVAAYLTEQQRKSNASGNGEVAQAWAEMEELYNKKLWHQLTLKLGQFVKHPSLSQGDALIKLYQNFIADFEFRINSLALVEMVIIISKQFKEPKEALEFLEKIKESVKGSEEATTLCLTAMGNIKIKQQNDLEGAKVIIKQAQAILDTLDGITSVHGRFYELSSNYYKLMSNHADYYRDALRFLGCMELNDIPVGEQAERAFNLGLAAILGKNVYNFGELLAHPVLESLKGTEMHWLIDLLYAFNSGDIAKFKGLTNSWQSQPDLVKHNVQMQQKISLLCLMEAAWEMAATCPHMLDLSLCAKAKKDEVANTSYPRLPFVMTFKRPAVNRQLTFEEIASEVLLPLNEVELLVMKALSLGLVKGSIDEVERKVHMTWVQPRVLDRDQIATLKQKMEHWSTSVVEMEKLVEVSACDILT